MKPPQSLKIACLLILLTLPAAVQAQFTFTTNNGAITISGYTGSGGAVTIPSTIYVPALTNYLPVTSIGDFAFQDCTSLTSVTIPNGVTSIGFGAFYFCTKLTSITIPASATNIEAGAFLYCASLTSVTIPNGVTSIGNGTFSLCLSLTNFTIPGSVTSIEFQAFNYCPSLSSITIPNSVTSIGGEAFQGCTKLTSVYFKGNAPAADSSVFSGDTNATVYYLPGTTGWPTVPNAWAGRPTALWSLPNPLILNNGPSFGVQTNGFGFIISWATNISVVVEACTNLAHPIWSPVGTNTLTGGSCYFSDPRWTNYPARFYRLCMP